MCGRLRNKTSVKLQPLKINLVKFTYPRQQLKIPSLPAPLNSLGQYVKAFSRTVLFLNEFLRENSSSVLFLTNTVIEEVAERWRCYIGLLVVALSKWKSLALFCYISQYSPISLHTLVEQHRRRSVQITKEDEVFNFKIFCVHDRITDGGIELFVCFSKPK